MHPLHTQRYKQHSSSWIKKVTRRAWATSINCLISYIMISYILIHDSLKSTWLNVSSFLIWMSKVLQENSSPYSFISTRIVPAWHTNGIFFDESTWWPFRLNHASKSEDAKKRGTDIFLLSCLAGSTHNLLCWMSIT